jgi:hypothetical protein
LSAVERTVPEDAAMERGRSVSFHRRRELPVALRFFFLSRRKRASA